MNRALSFLGLLNRGGRLVFGQGIESALHKIDLLLVANDAKNKERMIQKAISAKLVLCTDFSKAELGSALGYDELSYIGIKGKKEAKAFLNKTKGASNEEKQ